MTRFTLATGALAAVAGVGACSALITSVLTPDATESPVLTVVFAALTCVCLLLTVAMLVSRRRAVSVEPDELYIQTLQESRHTTR